MCNVILGIGGALGHDGNAALMVDGELIAATQEERFTRIKHDGSFPRHSIYNCLEIANLKPDDIDVCVFAEKSLQSYFFNQNGKPSNFVTRSLGYLFPQIGSIYSKLAKKMFSNAKFYYAWHHLSHAAASFHSSPFDTAAFLCVDGKGEDVSATIGQINHENIDVKYHQPYENGLGLLYTLVTYYLGFDSFGSEYKVMGLAPYGKPVYVDQLRSLTVQGNYGGIRLKENISFKHESMKSSIKYVSDVLGFPPRYKVESLTYDHADIAASLQMLFEEEIFKMVEFTKSKIKENNLLFCGGCAQNCVVAGKMRDSGIFNNVFNSPVGGDMGSGLGAVLLYERKRHRNGNHVKIDTRGFYLGSEPGEIPDKANKYSVKFDGSIHEYVANLLSEGKIVGWIRGGMELGARALGARSILADPRQKYIQSALNQKIKFRESFRPFAPSILAEEASKWFDINQPSDYMQYIAFLKKEHRFNQPETFSSMKEQLNFVRCKVPSIVHVDYSARLHTVDKDVHPDFYKLISSFYKITGVPMIINTSFNVSGQPIVRTAEDTWNCFVHTDIDYLVMNDTVYRNPFEKTKEEKIKWLEQFKQFSN